jgi:hypothetical protein
MNPELKLPRKENLFQCPGIVLVVAGYLLMSFASLFLFVGLRGTSFEPNISLFLLLPFQILVLMALYPAMIGGDRRRISSVQLFLFAEAIYIGLRYVYGAIEYPGMGVSEYPRPAFDRYVGALTVGVGQLVMTIASFVVLFAPSVRGWVRGGVQRAGEPSQLLADGAVGVKSFSDRNFGGWDSLRVTLWLMSGVAAHLAVIFSGSIVGRAVPQPDKLSFEALIDQLETKDQWQLRMRHEVSDYVGLHILKYSAVEMAKMPPSTISGLRWEAVTGLSRFGSQAVGPLEVVLSDSDLSVRHAAVTSLGKIGAEASEISDTLRAMILDPELPLGPDESAWAWGGLRRALVMALLQIGPDDLLDLDAILKAFETVNGPGLQSFIVDLTRSDDPISKPARPYLASLLSRGSAPIKFYVLRTLRSMDRNLSSYRSQFRLHPSLIEEATQLLLDSEDTIRREAALLLSGDGLATDAMVEQMIAFVSDEHPEVVRAAMHFFERRGGYTRLKVSVEILIGQLNRWKAAGSSLRSSEYWHDSSSMVRPAETMDYATGRNTMVNHSSHITLSEFGFNFGESNPQEAYEKVKQSLSGMQQPNESERTTIRRMMIRVLGAHRGRAEWAEPVLQKIVANQNSPERWEAAISLWKMTRRAEDFLTIFSPFIEHSMAIQPDDPKYAIVASVIKSLGEMGGPALPLFSVILTYSDSGLRLDAYDEIEKLLPTNPSARSLMETLVDDSHGIIQLRAQKALEKLDQGL